MTAPLRHEVDVSRAKYLPAPTFERLLGAALSTRRSTDALRGMK
jgi:hypothetical protein